MNKLKSRKLWVAIGTVASILIAEYFEVDVDPEALAGLAFVAIGYMFSQGIVDKSVVTEQVKVAGDVGRAQLELYARNLEDQLVTITEQLEATEVVQQLTSVPDLE